MATFAREFQPITVVNTSPAKQVGFQELLESNPINYRKDRLLMKQIKKVFADGIRLEDPQEEIGTRRAAYCLTLGISPQFLSEHMSPLYSGFLRTSKSREEQHKERIQEFKEKNGPYARLPLDSCCDDVHMCKIIRQIKKDVPRTTSTFQMPQFSETP